MERNYQLGDSSLVDYQELHKQTAFHEAGHAAAIHYGNRQKNLPPVFFEIQIKKPEQNNGRFSAKVIDGQLIQNLPMAIVDNLSDLSDSNKHSYQCAYEADVMNLLVGPLAEAKYVAERDNEVFNPNLVDLNALKHYGGGSDVDKAHAYLNLFIASRVQREKKLSQLLGMAHRFINDSLHWQAISRLARLILDNERESISCEEAIALFNQDLVNQYSTPRCPAKNTVRPSSQSAQMINPNHRCGI